MKGGGAIVKATVREVLSEPLSLLILISAQALSVLAPAFHYHQFGEATRMARDAGCSSLFLGGSVLAVFVTIRVFRREIESGTLQMALAHPISRGGFFLFKSLGCFCAYLVFAFLMFVTMMLVVWGADIGGALAARTGDVARLFGPCLAAGMTLLTLPLVLAAALNRFLRFRFVTSVFALSFAFSVVLLVLMIGFRAELCGRYLPAVLLLGGLALMLVLASAALSVRFRANGAASLVGLVVLACVPMVGNYYLADALSQGGVISLAYCAWAGLALLPAVLAFAVLGVHFMNGRETES